MLKFLTSVTGSESWQVGLADMMKGGGGCFIISPFFLPNNKT